MNSNLRNIIAYFFVLHKIGNPSFKSVILKPSLCFSRTTDIVNTQLDIYIIDKLLSQRNPPKTLGLKHLKFRNSHTRYDFYL